MLKLTYFLSSRPPFVCFGFCGRRRVARRSWCKFLHSVEYVGFVDDWSSSTGGDGTDDNDDGGGGSTPLRESRWTVGVRGLRFR